MGAISNYVGAFRFGGEAAVLGLGEEARIDEHEVWAEHRCHRVQQQRVPADLEPRPAPRVGLSERVTRVPEAAALGLGCRVGHQPVKMHGSVKCRAKGLA